MDIKVTYTNVQAIVADKNKPSENKASAKKPTEKPSDAPSIKPTEAVYFVSPSGDVFEA